MAYWSLTEMSGWGGAQPVHTLPLRVLWPRVSEEMNSARSSLVCFCRRLAPWIWFYGSWAVQEHRIFTGGSEMECCSRRFGALFFQSSLVEITERHIKAVRRSARLWNFEYKIIQRTSGFCLPWNMSYPQVSCSPLYRRNICSYVSSCLIKSLMKSHRKGHRRIHKYLFRGHHQGHPIFLFHRL